MSSTFLSLHNAHASRLSAWDHLKTLTAQSEHLCYNDKFLYLNITLWVVNTPVALLQQHKIFVQQQQQQADLNLKARNPGTNCSNIVQQAVLLLQSDCRFVSFNLVWNLR